MTPFLVATLLALVVGGALAIVWRDYRAWFARVLGGVVLLAVLIGTYAWTVSHGHEVLGDTSLVSLQDLTLTEVAGSYRVRGFVRNNSRDRVISAVPLLLWVEHCPETPGDAAMPCERHQEIGQTLIVSVQPEESRPFVLVFSASPLPREIRNDPARLRFRLTHEGPRTHAAAQR